MKPFTIIATAPMGIEALVAKEIRDLGYEDCIVENGRVIFKGDAKDIARVNLWVRTADRIKILVGEFKARSFDELFEKTKALPWGDILPFDAEFPVTGKSNRSMLHSVPDCQAIVKKSIVESLRTYYKKTVTLPETGPFYKIEVSLLKDIATLSIDTSGAGLHKRGYRVNQGEAPLKETLAAALVMLTNWRGDRPFVDPMCGSGTIPIEAAMIAQNIAPGFNRDFVSEEWPWMTQEIWDEARNEVEDLANYDKEINITGFDRDARMISIAKDNAIEAGFGEIIKFEQKSVQDFYSQEGYGTIVTNPPYGERLQELREVEALYRDMGQVFSVSPVNTWSIYVLTAYESFEEAYGKKATKKRKLFNGPIRADYYQYYGPRPPKNEVE